MDLNYLFNQHLKTIGIFLTNKLPDEDFKQLKFLTRQTQDSIAEMLKDMTREDLVKFIKSSVGGYHEKA